MTKKKTLFLPVLIAVFFACAAAIGVYMVMKPSDGPEAETARAIEEIKTEVCRGYSDDTVGRAASNALTVEADGAPLMSFRNGTQELCLTALDCGRLCEGIEEDMQRETQALVLAARRRRDIYNEDGSYRQEIVEAAYESALSSRLEHISDYLVQSRVTLALKYAGGAWSAECPPLSLPAPDYPTASELSDRLEAEELDYALPDLTSPGPVPNPECFGETDDSAVISALLETENARRLINGQATDWSPEKELIPGTTIHYYLDETILALVWQEVEHGAVGTFSEVFIADASQLRRKLADDTPLCYKYYYPTELSRQVNAVVALSGDFYDHPDRNYGICVYDGEVFKYCLSEGETCCFDDKGNMLFVYPGSFDDVDAAQQFMDDRHIMFSLSFGPVLIENGIDVTPYDYPLGEVRDTYARCCIGQLGERHYLSMTINVKSPDYYVYVTLRQAADSMIAHGCTQAYTLDGGQTGSIIIGNRLINPVQFGVEREMSDIFYFASAVED